MGADRTTSALRGGPGVGIKWHRRISVKLAFGLGLAMFSLQVLTTQLLITAYRGSLEDLETSPTAPYASYLRNHVHRNEEGKWIPTQDAIDTIETFLAPSETYLWLDPMNRVLLAGTTARELTDVGQEWSLCDSPRYCEISTADGQHSAGSAWARLAAGGRPVGTFVLIWFEAPQMTAGLSQRQLQIDVFLRLAASGLVAALTSILLVSLVTRRLSRLATDASTPLDENVENVDLPGPFEIAGEDEIARLARALNTMRGRIEVLVEHLADRDRQRRDWIAQVSHDLRTPLTALVACLDRTRERLAEDTRGVDRDAILDAIAVAHQDSHRLQTLVDDLFELARLDANEELTLEPVPPGELVRQTVRGLMPIAELKGIRLTSSIAPALPTIRADGRRLMRALENMVRNAIHFGRTDVRLSAAQDGEYLRFEVTDDGPGLPLVDGEVLLAQTDHGPRRPDSAGLGLIVTRRVAEAHGGSLAGANRDEGGAKVWIRIPIVPADAAQTQAT